MWQEPFCHNFETLIICFIQYEVIFNVWEYFFLIPFSKLTRVLSQWYCKSHLHNILIFRFICNFILFWLIKCFITMIHKVCGRYKKHMSHHIFFLSYRISPLSKFSPAMRVFSQTFPTTWVLLSSFPVMRVIKRHRCHNWLFRLHIQSSNSEINLNTLLYTCLIQRWSN